MMSLFRIGFVLSVLLSTLAGAASAEVTPAGVFTDHMVLQRDKPAPVWGWADPGEEVTVQFAGQSKSATADARGKWRVVLDPLKLGAKAQTLTIEGRNRIELTDVLVGDIWICSGQSNMGRSASRSIYPEDMSMVHSTIRYIGGGNSAKYPLKQVDNTNGGHVWKVCADEESTMGCCAIGFFFARRVQEDVDVPIGILWTAWAGSIIQEWIPRHGWRLDPELADMADKVDIWYPNTPLGRKVWTERLDEIETWRVKAEQSLADGSPFPFPQPMMPEPKDRDICGFYNGKVHPYVPLAVKGVLWYQGESDYRNTRWDLMLKVMAESWRDLFDVAGDGRDIPFYWMQIQRSGDYCSPLIRDEQLRALKIVPNSGMAVLLDLDVNVHPVNKYDSGERLALWALAKDYGQKIVYSGPLYKGHRIDGDKVIIEFDHARDGLMLGKKDKLDPAEELPDAELTNVKIAGEDKQWHAAKATLVGQTLVVSSPEVAKPVAVRYCYENIPAEPFLYNKAGLPAAQFRTDDWSR